MGSGVGSGARGGYQSKALLVEGFVGRDWQARFRLAQRVLQAGGRSRAVVAEPAEREQCWARRLAVPHDHVAVKPPASSSPQSGAGLYVMRR